MYHNGLNMALAAFYPEAEGCPLKLSYHSSRLHGVITHKTKIKVLSPSESYYSFLISVYLEARNLTQF